MNEFNDRPPTASEIEKTLDGSPQSTISPADFVEAACGVKLNLAQKRFINKFDYSDTKKSLTIPGRKRATMDLGRLAEFMQYFGEAAQSK